MNIPKSPLEVSHIIETQRLETEAKCLSSIECADCGTSTTNWTTCPKCQRQICSFHIDPARGICTTCKTDLDTENQNYHSEIELAAFLRQEEIKRLKDAESKTE